MTGGVECRVGAVRRQLPQARARGRRRRAPAVAPSARTSCLSFDSLGGADHVDAAGDGQLDRDGPDATGGAGQQERLTGLQ